MSIHESDENAHDSTSEQAGALAWTPDEGAMALKSSEVPQANSLDRIRQFVEAVRQGATQKKAIQAITGLSARHADYYGQAARTLGWVDRQGENYSLKQAAATMLQTPPTSLAETAAFVQSIEACKVVQAIAPDLLKDPGPSEEQLTQRIKQATDLAHKTAKRRAQALLTWRARIVIREESEEQDLMPLLIDEDGSSDVDMSLTLWPRIESVEVEHFKGIRQGSVDLTGLTVFIGSHGAGKSSLRDLFRFLHALGRAYSLTEMADERWGEAGTLEWSGIRGGPGELPYLGSDSFAIGVSLAVPDGNQLRSGRYEIEVRAPQEGTPTVVREKLVLDGRGDFVFDSHPQVDPPLQLPERLAVRLGKTSRSGTRGPTLLVDPRKPALGQLALHPAVRTRSVTNSAGTVMKAFRSLRFLAPQNEAMRRPSLPNQLILGDHGENLSSVLQSISAQPEGRESLQQSLRAFTDGNVCDVNFVPDASGRILVCLEDRHGTRLSAHSASDGVLSFLLLLAALLGPESPGFWFIDNVDAGFSPSKLGYVLEVLERYAKATSRQLVVTMRNEEAQTVLNLDSEAITSAYQMYAYGWRTPQRMGTPPEPPAPQRSKSRADDGDLNELLPF